MRKPKMTKLGQGVRSYGLLPHLRDCIYKKNMVTTGHRVMTSPKDPGVTVNAYIYSSLVNKVYTMSLQRLFAQEDNAGLV